jgi:DNA-binding transcriptional LysR family regulator
VRATTEFPLGLVSQPDHPLAARESVPLSEAAQYPIVAPGEPLALCAPLGAMLAAAGISMNIVAETNNIQMIKSLAREGVGLGVLCWIDAADEVARGELAFTPFARASPYPLTLALCVDRSRQLSAAPRLLLGWMELAVLGLGQG